MKITVDASVVIKWFVAEVRHEEARTVLGHRIERHAPDFVLVECANVLWKKARRGEIADPGPFLEEFLRLSDVLTLHRTASLLPVAVRTAGELDHPVYDCLYLACAELTGSALLTDDQKLAGKATSRLPGPDVLALDDAGAIENIRWAAMRLVIDRDRLEELVEASQKVSRTRKSLADGRRLVDPAMVIDSPASRRLRDMVRNLSREERVDLLALGWLAQNGPEPGWEHWFNHACEMVGSVPERYFMGFDWAGGLELLRREQEGSS